MYSSKIGAKMDDVNTVSVYDVRFGCMIRARPSTVLYPLSLKTSKAPV